MNNAYSIKFSLFSLLFLPSLLVSANQDFDEAYLESLPEDIREQVMKEAQSKKSEDKPVYRRPSSMIDKPNNSTNSNNPNNTNNSTNSIISDESKDYSVKRFGSDFFSKMQSSFMPINEPNMDGSYILDFGDILGVQLVGQESYEDKFSIYRDGSINIPDIGKIFVAGLSLNSASELIQLKVKESFIGTDAFVSLLNIRDIQILVSGNVFSPGFYTLNGNSNIFQAIYFAGGVNDSGTFRAIKHIRNGKVIHTFDLYDVFINGVLTMEGSLKSGDSILIPPAEKIVNIIGGVKRPLLYELVKGETVADLISFANGFSNDAKKNKIVLESYINGRLSRTDINEDNLNILQPSFGDALFIEKFNYKKVTLEGAVSMPGEYLIKNGTTLSEVIVRAGGYIESAYQFGGYLENKKTMVINREANSRLYNRFLDNMSASSLEDSAGLGILLDQIKNAPVSGRVIAEFDLDVIEFNPGLDTILEEDDRLMVPYLTQQVYVYGEVNNEGTVRYEPNKSIDFYISTVGGFDNFADKKNIFILHPNGKTEVLTSKSRQSILSNSNNNDLIFPGSIIFVPRTTAIQNKTQIASIWAPIISSFALTATSLSVLSSK